MLDFFIKLYNPYDLFNKYLKSYKYIIKSYIFSKYYFQKRFFVRISDIIVQILFFQKKINVFLFRL